jgi:hypothetical protein
LANDFAAHNLIRNFEVTICEREVTARLDSHEKAIVELMRQFLTIINPGNETEPADISPKREIGFHVKDTAERKSVRSKRAR